MINEFSLHAVPSNKKANRVVNVCFVLSLVCLVITAFMDKYKGFVGIVLLGFITVALYFYTRYLAARYIYDITTDAEQRPIFVVRSKTGKRVTTMSRIDFYNIKKVERISADDLKNYKPDEGVVKYTYCPSYKPDTMIMLSVRGRFEKADVLIEAPDEFMEHLRQIAAEAIASYTENEE